MEGDPEGKVEFTTIASELGMIPLGTWPLEFKNLRILVTFSQK